MYLLQIYALFSCGYITWRMNIINLSRWCRWACVVIWFLNSWFVFTNINMDLTLHQCTIHGSMNIGVTSQNVPNQLCRGITSVTLDRACFWSRLVQNIRFFCSVRLDKPICWLYKIVNRCKHAETFWKMP